MRYRGASSRHSQVVSGTITWTSQIRKGNPRLPWLVPDKSKQVFSLAVVTGTATLSRQVLFMATPPAPLQVQVQCGGERIPTDNGSGPGDLITAIDGQVLETGTEHKGRRAENGQGEERPVLGCSLCTGVGGNLLLSPHSTLDS